MLGITSKEPSAVLVNHRLPRRTPTLQIFLAHLKLNEVAAQVNVDDVAILHKRNGRAVERLGTARPMHQRSARQ